MTIQADGNTKKSNRGRPRYRILEGGVDLVNSCYKVRACCNTAGCAYTDHIDIIQTINHESSFSFSMFMNALGDRQGAATCPVCGQPLYYYPVTNLAEPTYH